MKFLNNISPYAHWALRLALASVFLFHGIYKFTDLAGFAQMMQMPEFVALLVALAETVGGVLVIAGGFTKDWITRLAALMFIPVLIGAIFMVHWPQWNFVASATHKMGGMEFQVVLLLIALYLVITGNNGRQSAA